MYASKEFMSSGNAVGAMLFSLLFFLLLLNVEHKIINKGIYKWG